MEEEVEVGLEGHLLPGRKRPHGGRGGLDLLPAQKVQRSLELKH